MCLFALRVLRKIISLRSFVFLGDIPKPKKFISNVNPTTVTTDASKSLVSQSDQKLILDPPFYYP